MKNGYYQPLKMNFAVLLTDVRYCFLGKAHQMSREKIVLMLDEIVHNEHIFYMTLY